MALSMYQASVPVYIQMLEALAGVLAKATADAAARKIEPAALLQSRLYPDMLPLLRQVQIATDLARSGAARLAGLPVPSETAADASFDDLETRIARTLAFVRSLEAEQIDGSESRQIEIKLPQTTLTFTGQTFLLGWSLPNFFFHVTTAYALLRHAGVPVGKKDFVGTVGANPESQHARTVP